MYVICISLYSLPFTGFESLPESVQTNLSKSPRNPQVICLFPAEVSDLFMMGPIHFKVGSEPPEPRLIRKFPLVKIKSTGGLGKPPVLFILI